MNKNLKNCFAFLTTLIIISICSLSSGISGLFFGFVVSEDQNKQRCENQEIVEKEVYITQETTERYIDQDSPGDVYNKLLQNSAQHFTFEFRVKNEKQFYDYRDFILVNLENQYSRLSAKFDIELSSKVKVVLVDDIDVYENNLEFDYDIEISEFAAYAKGDDFIEIYQNPRISYSKFEIARLISHELVHTFQFNAKKYASYDIPRWFLEGTAEALSYPNEEPIIVKDILNTASDLDSMSELLLDENPERFVVGYDTSHLFVNYLILQYGEETVIDLLKFSYPTKFDDHYVKIIGHEVEKDYDKWIETL